MSAGPLPNVAGNVNASNCVSCSQSVAGDDTAGASMDLDGLGNNWGYFGDDILQLFSVICGGETGSGGSGGSGGPGGPGKNPCGS